MFNNRLIIYLELDFGEVGMSCGQCQGIEIIFDEKNAIKEKKSFLKKGAHSTTKSLLKAIREHAGPIESLIDIGGGVGAIQLKATEWGVPKIINVDASGEYIKIAQDIANTKGVDGQIEYHVGDITELGPQLSPVDVVTLDKVFCCYDQIEKLLEISSHLAKKLYAVVYPKDTWLNKRVMSVLNFFMIFKKNPFRTFIHSSKYIDDTMANQGWKKTVLQKGIFWQVVVFQK